MIDRLRASHRKLAKAPYHNFGLPYHSFKSTDVQPLPKDQAVELQFSLLPMSYIFPKGHRINLNITFMNPVEGQAKTAVWTGGVRRHR